MEWIWKEIFSNGEFTGKPLGRFSIEHITLSVILLVGVIVLGIVVGKHYKNKEEIEKAKVIRITGIIILCFWIAKIIVWTIEKHNILIGIMSNLPLFLCDMMFLAIPLAGFLKKCRFKEVVLDFIFVFGMLCSLMGTLFGAVIDDKPIYNFHLWGLLITHLIPGFVVFYIGVSGLKSMKKNNVLWNILFYFSFIVMAYIVDIFSQNAPWESNYMFLIDDAGTPFSIIMSIAGKTDLTPLFDFHSILYAILVTCCMLSFIGVFYLIYFLIIKIINNKKLQ